jgi:RHS repeat-associated protein
VQVSAASRAPAPSSVRVSVAGRRATASAGIRGVILSVSRADGGTGGAVRVRLSYRGFGNALGGAWSSRLRLVQLPACALTRPGQPGCRRQVPVRSVNDAAARSLSAVVTLPRADGVAAAAAHGSGLVLAATAGPSGPAGSYSATPLTPSGTWAVQQGGFTYTYPFAVPASLGGAAPRVALSYDSQSVDGETSGANTQGGMAGDGWDYSPGFIERSYQSCSQDSAATAAEAGDECWGGYNATLSLGGRSGILVKDGSSGTWHLQGDDGTQVQLLQGAANGVWNGEYWLVTTGDGTKYYFGQNHLPGGSGSDGATNSAWGVPVYNPGSSDPCFTAGSGSSSECQMGWRWNLDYVVDPAGNLTVYDYQKETNYYQMGGATGGGTLTQYVRAGFPVQVSYGWLLKDAIAGTQSAARVDFGYSQRCTGSQSECSSFTNLNSGNSSDWPDTPFDQICGSSGSCTNVSPTYFSTYMLTSVTSKVLKSGTWSSVDSYALSQSFPAAPGSNPVIFLNSVTRTGLDGGSVTLPAVTFNPAEFDNRVDGLVPSAPPVARPRIVAVTTEAGAQVAVVYNPPACSRVNGTMPSSADSNTMSCFPVYWTPPGLSQIRDWFNKYLVGQVVVNDMTGAGSPSQVTSYAYIGNAAWHQNTSPVVPAATRTWDQYRGYEHVDVMTGESPDPVTQTRYTYMQGMDGDAKSGGGTKSVTVTDPNGDPPVTDSNWLAGQMLETDTYTGSGTGTVDKRVVNGPWTYTQTASQAQPGGLANLTAHMLAQSGTRTIISLAGGGLGTDQLTTYYDSQGRVTQVDHDPQGAGVTETCATTAYATPPSGNPMMADYPRQVTTVTGAYSGGCPAATAANIVSDTRTYYDDPSATLTSMGTLGSLTSPGGLATGAQRAVTFTGSTETWQAQSVTAHDAYGRVTSAIAAASTGTTGNKTTTAYTPAYTSGATTELPTKITVTNPLGWTAVTTLGQGREQPLTVTDANGEVTTESYDPLGRLTSVWLPIDPVSGPASYKYAYSVTGTAPSAVTSSTLREDSSYSTDVQIYDGMLQPRQQQATPANAAQGRLISDAFYDSHGWAVKTSDPYYDSTTGPGATLFIAQDGQVPAQTLTGYDGQGRVTSTAFFSLGTRQWQTTTAYPGMNQADTTPPAGGTATSALSNVLGQQTASWQYTTATPDGNAAHADVTSYAYTPAGQVASVADNAGNTWTYGYDLLGQKVSSTDPGTTGTAGPNGKAGKTTYSYDPAGNLTSTTSPLGVTLTSTYDALNRRTAQYNGAVSGADQLAGWAYDTLKRGQLTSSTSYTSGSAGPAYKEAVAGYTVSYQPTGTTTTIPSAAGKLAGTYTTTSAYTTVTGLLQSTGYSADGGLPPETVNYSYDLEGKLAASGGNAAYLDQDIYTPQGQIQRATFGSFGVQLVQTYSTDPATARLLTTTTNLQTLPAVADATSYTYNPAGDITSSSDAQNTGGTQTQCYAYDNLQQLTTAWTDAGGTTTLPAPSVPGIGGCANTAPSAAALGGPAPYWRDWTYNLLGDRTSQTSHNTAGNTALDITQTSTYPAAAAPAQPDAATSIKTQYGTTGSSDTTTPAYDAAGNTKSQANTTSGASPPPAPPAESAITYTPQGRTAQVTTTAGVSTYTYDASGNLLLQADPAATTLYLDGGTEELTLTGTTVTGRRYYLAPDATTVVRSSGGAISYQIASPAGTAAEAINAATDAISRRYFDPYGNPIGTPPAWPDAHGFAGQPADPATALGLLGARQYDPATGRFLSLDPVFETGSPLQMGGYAYAASNPVTGSDPTGLAPGFTCGGMPCPAPGSGGHGGNGGGGGNESGNGGQTGPGSGSSITSPSPSAVNPVIQHLVEMNQMRDPQTAVSYPPVPELRPGGPACGGGRLMNLVGCGPAGTWGWGLTDTAGLGVTGLGGLGMFSSKVGRGLGNPDLTPAERSLAGARLSYLSRNPGWADAAALGRNAGLLKWGGGFMVVAGGVLTAIGYHQAGDPWWKAIGKGAIATGFSFVGAFAGGQIGFLAGTAIGAEGADITGIPEVGGAILGAGLGGYFGGVVGNSFANRLLGP